MNFLDKKIIIALVLATVAISGCVKSQAAIKGIGLVITDFDSTISEIEGKDKLATISLAAENQGGSTIPNAKACLMGSNFPGSTAEGMWGRVDATQTICQVKTGLKAYDPVNNIPGGSITAKWKLSSPCIPALISRSDSFTGRVYYDYTTTAMTTVWVYADAEIQAARQRGEEIPTSLTIDKTVGPIDIFIDTAQPIRAEDESFTIKITFSNVGGGTLVNQALDWSAGDSLPTVDDTNLNIFSARISVPSGVVATDCTNELSEIELKKGSAITKSCDVNITGLGVTTKKSFPITIRADYAYYIDKDLAITTMGKRGQTC